MMISDKSNAKISLRALGLGLSPMMFQHANLGTYISYYIPALDISVHVSRGLARYATEPGQLLFSDLGTKRTRAKIET